MPLTNVDDLIQSVEGLRGTKKKGKFSTSLFLSWDIHHLLPSDTGTTDYQAFRPDWCLQHWLPCFSGLWVWTSTILPTFLGFYLPDHRSQDFSDSNCTSPSLIIIFSFYILLVLFFWRNLIIGAQDTLCNGSKYNCFHGGVAFEVHASLQSERLQSNRLKDLSGECHSFQGPWVPRYQQIIDNFASKMYFHCSLFIYLFKWHHFIKDNLKLQWLFWQTLNLNKTFLLRGTLERKCSQFSLAKVTFSKECNVQNLCFQKISQPGQMRNNNKKKIPQAP